MKTKTNKCLYCYEDLKENEMDFHSKCSKKFFGIATPPTLSLTKEELNKMAREIIKRSVTIPGVQPKLSLSLKKNSTDPKKSRLTIVGLWGEYILKPQSDRYECMPENEDLVMHLAEKAGINTARHTLLRTESGQLVYVTKRFDRVDKKKAPMEDFCQLAGKLSADKYKSTIEAAGLLISKYSSPSSKTTDLITFFDIAIFSFLVGNSDMHLKNFSIIKDEENQYKLSPAYDLMSTNLAMPSDKEEVALSLHKKKHRLSRYDFVSFGKHIGLTDTLIQKALDKYDKEMLNEFEKFTSISFLPDDLKDKFISLMKSRFKIL